ncbi:MAG: tol-pal system YbgF family protein [Salibacteraceae bacterium]
MGVIEARLALKRAGLSDAEMVEGLASNEREWEIIRELVKELEPNFVQYVRFRNGKEEDARTLFRDAILIVRQHIRNGQYDPNALLRTYLFAVGKFLWLYRFGDELKPDFQDTEPEIDLSGDPLLDWLEHGRSGHARNHEVDLNRFREQLKSVEVEVEEAKKPTRNRSTRMAWLGMLGLLLFVAGYLIWQGAFPSGRVLFNDNFQPYRMPAVTFGGDNWDKALGFYIAADYPGALEQLDGLSLEEASYLADFYRGMCLLAHEESDPMDAVPYFKQVINQDTDYKEVAIWYLSLAYLKAGDKPAARENLEKLATDGYQHQAVAALMSDL